MENIITFTFFPTKVKSIYLEDFADEKENFVARSLEMYRQSLGNTRVDWRCPTFTTLDLFDIKDDLVFKFLLKKIQKEVVLFSKEFGVKNENLHIKDAWINVAEKHAYQEYHLHADSHFSAVFYIKVPVNSGNIVFRSFEADTDMFPLPIVNYTEASFKTMSFSPKENNLLIFRSNLKHMVESNANDDFRISLSLNFKFHDSE